MLFRAPKKEEETKCSSAVRGIGDKELMGESWLTKLRELLKGKNGNDAVPIAT
jgi:hypothetical protein